jgi:hypothetical protein
MMRLGGAPMRRREFIAGLGSAAPWPIAARAQQPALPLIGFVNQGSADAYAGQVAAFRKGLGETGYVDGQNVTIEYHWLEGQYDRLPTVMADLLRRPGLAVIATPANTPGAIAAKAATARIPIVFGVGEDPEKIPIATDLREADYVVWRDGAVLPPGKRGQGGLSVPAQCADYFRSAAELLGRGMCPPFTGQPKSLFAQIGHRER